MKRYPHAAAAMFVALSAACTDADLILDVPTPPQIDEPTAVLEQVRHIGDVSRVTLTNVGALYITQGERPELRVRGERVVLDHLRTSTQDGELSIGMEGSFTLDHELDLKCFLTVPDLEAIRIEGLWKVEGSRLNTGPLTVVLDGIGEVVLNDLTAPQLDVVNTGIGEVSASGSVDMLSVELDGAGTYQGRHLLSHEARVIISGNGSATVAVNDWLDATIEGSGSVYYIGDPVVSRTGSGTGRVVKQGS